MGKLCRIWNSSRAFLQYYCRILWHLAVCMRILNICCISPELTVDTHLSGTISRCTIAPRGRTTTVIPLLLVRVMYSEGMLGCAALAALLLLPALPALLALPA